ncbi:MAG TPA: hypothetical protein VHN74_02110 [Candidatus Angelobacter sp.]|jgi:hypothetical protein|nr:hypothetical protein [Candidatus Angelobacter sp.]
MQRFVPVLILLTATIGLAGCGGSSSNKNAVAQVTVSQTDVSLVAGDVSTPLAPKALNSAGGPVTTTFTFNTSNPALVTVSPSGLICAGIWDSTFVTCNPASLVGQAVVTASAAGVSSAPVNVSVHQSVTSIQIDPATLIAPGSCISNKQTHQFTAKALHNGTDITSQVGQINWTSTDFSVVGIDSNGLATAGSSGQAGIVANVGNTTSTSVPFRTCMPTTIRLHVQNDTPGNLTTSATLNVNDTRVLQADWADENGVLTNAAPVSFTTTSGQVVSLSGASGVTTITGQSPGGAIIVASCSPPSCGNGILQPVYSNPFKVTVAGTSPNTTTVWAASTTAAATSNIVPIDISKSPPVLGTAINLPGTPNSIVFNLTGTRAFIGTSGGLASLDPVGNAVTTIDVNTTGKVLAVSPDATKVILSNALSVPLAANQRLFIFDATNNTIQTFIKPGVVSAAFTTDGFKAFISATDGHVYVYSPFISLQTLTDAGAPDAATVLPSGPLAFIGNGGGIDAFAVCNNSPQTSPPTSGAPQILGNIPNANQIVSLTSTSLDIISATPADAASGFCPQTASYSLQTINFGVGSLGSFSPNDAGRLLIGSNGAHIAVLPHQKRILVAIPGGGPGVINLAGNGTEAFSGGLTLDGNTAWVGVAGSNDVHRINLLSSADDFQINPNVNGNGAPPDLVAIRPK